MHRSINSKPYAIAAVALLGLTASASHAATILLNEDFEDAVRVVGASGSINGVDVDGVTPLTNDYAVSTNGNANQATGTSASDVGPGIAGDSFFVKNEGSAYSITTRFADTALAVGDSLAVSLTIRTSGAAPGVGAGAFRIGLFDRGTIELGGNSNAFGGATGGASTNAFSDDVGYFAFYSTEAAALAVKGQQRPAAAGNLFAGGADIGTGTSAPTALAVNTDYTVLFAVTRTAASTVSITSSLNGATLATTDTTAPFTTFDELGLFFSGAFGNGTAPRSNFVDDVVVTFTPAAPVPEPAGLGLLGLGAVAALRRRRHG